ncbi:MAG: response regulator [Clostridiales bacterium]|nr:response regulator [Clostridiales bacterium]
MNEKPFVGEVLLCEDNPMMQELVTEQLSRVGIKTVIAENGLVGVETVRERVRGEMFGLIFMDINMPVMDGIEATKKILEMNTGVPIIALTADISEKEQQLYSKIGMVASLGKPFRPKDLLVCLEKYYKPIMAQEEEITDELRTKLIEIFVRINSNKFTEISEALQNGDIKTAHRMAHTLRSNAGQLEKTELEKAAEQIEQLLKNSENHVAPEHLETLEKELNAALSEFEPLIQNTVPEEPSDIVFSGELFEKLEPLLNENNPECLDYVRVIRLIPGSGELIRHIENFDFHDASVALAKLKERLS